MIDREILEAIKAEIRKLKENPYFMMALKEVGVIDSSQEEPVSIDLEEAAKDYSWAINKQVEYTKKEITTDAEITEIDIKNAYIAGADWQRRKMMGIDSYIEGPKGGYTTTTK